MRQFSNRYLEAKTGLATFGLFFKKIGLLFILKFCHTEQKKPSGKNNKNQLTGKIISFILKLKNENSTQHKSTRSNDHTIENDNENSLIINEVYDLDYDENDDSFYVK